MNQLSSFPQHPQARYVAMKDSWGHGEDRRDRGRVDRGVNRSRSPPLPPSQTRRLDRERERERERDPKPKERERERDRNSNGTRNLRPPPPNNDRPRDRERERSPDRRRRTSRSPPPRDSRDEVRERNRGRELLDTRGSEKQKRSNHHSPSATKRRKTRSPSPSRNHHKKSRRGNSRSPPRPEAERGSRTSSRPDKKRRPGTPPHRRRSQDRKGLDSRGGSGERRNKIHREAGFPERRPRSPSPGRGRKESRPISPARQDTQSKPDRQPHRSPERNARPREKTPLAEADRKAEQTTRSNQASSEIDRYESFNPSRQPSPRAPAPRGPKGSRGSSPRRDRGGRHPRDEYRQSGKPGKSKGKNGRPTPAASGANSIEVKGDKMAHRGFYGGNQGYNPNQQMQAAFPLKPQYNQGPPQVDPRQYSQSPQHQMTPNSYHSSPQAQSPYGDGRGNWNNQQPQQQYSPQPQYHQNQQQAGFSPPAGPQGQYYNNAQSPPYQNAPTGPMNNNSSYPQQHSNFRGGGRGFRGNNNFNSRGRGGRGGNQYQWNNSGNQQGAGRGQHHGSGNVTPQHNSQHASPQQQYPPQPQYAGSHDGNTQPVEEEEEDADDLFRPSKELQVEDKDETKKKEEEQMPPPTRPTPTGPQGQQNSSKFSFAFKASSKNTPAHPKPEISQKLNAAPSKPTEKPRAPSTSRIPIEPSHVPDRPRGPSGRPIPTEPAYSRRQDFREQHPPQPKPPAFRKVKKTLRRPKPRPQLPEDLKKSDSVYYRKPGNESVVGSGTYGKVFKAVHVYTKNLVALKKIRMEGERDGFPVTAVREIKLLQSLKHQNVVRLHEVMVEKNDCFMVFEYLSHDLTGLLNHPTFKLEPAHKKHLAKQLFEGLDYLHRRGVLHRDIKAANILVSNTGQLKLADFGLARFYAKRRQLDYTNRVITIWYRSPELLLGETQYGPAVDIWSAACVLVEIFTRHAIFPGDGGEISQLEKIYAILGTPNKTEWPGLVDMAWFELLRPNARRPNVFAEKYRERVTPAAFELLEAMFLYDPVKRPSASDVLEHPYFTVEEPMPKQAVELADLTGDWHEFESKALRKENERKEKEARRQHDKEKEKEKKRSTDDRDGAVDAEREAKRINTGMGPPEKVVVG